MAIQFDELDDYYLITDAASLTLPDGDWCVGIRAYVSDNAGTGYQYLVNTGLFANNAFHIALQEDDNDAGGDNGCWFMYTEDGDGTTIELVAGTTGGDSKWRLIIAQRDANASEIQLWFCELGAIASKEDSVADTDFAAVNGGDWNIGRRTDGDHYYGSIACEFFVLNAALTQDEITALGTGLRPHDLGYVSNVYLEMFTADATLRDMFGSNDAARQSVPTSVHHQPIMRTPRAVAFNDPPSLY